MDLIEDLRSFKPFNEQEAEDRKIILERLNSDPLAFSRDSIAHITCSIWTVDPAFSETLLIYHNIYDSWSWIGGHADNCNDLEAVALRELEEETGLSEANIIPFNGSKILSCEVLTVNGHEKRGHYVPSHMHMNITYLAVANPKERTRIKANENSGVHWVPLEDAVSMSTEPWIRERIYRKLIEKTRIAGSSRQGY